MDESALVGFAQRCLEPILGNQPEGWFFLAGGAFKSLLHGRPPRDLDLWPATPADRRRLAAQLARRGALLGRANPPYQTSYTLSGQLIELAHDTSVAGLPDWMRRCDLALSAIGVEHRDGEWRGAIHPRALDSIHTREVLLLTPLVNWKYALATLDRLYRYAAELGFGIPAKAEQAIWRVYDRQTREEQRKMIARYLRVCAGDGKILDKARSRGE